MTGHRESADATWVVEADREACCGAGKCFEASPEVFDLDDDGIVIVLDEHPDDSLLDRVARAERSCPTHAVRLTSIHSQSSEVHVTTTATSPKNIDDLPFLDLSSDEFFNDSYRMLTEMRERTWAARTEIGIMMLGYEDIDRILTDTRFRQPGVVTFEMQGVTDGPAYHLWDQALMHLDGDQHTRIRRTVSGAFSAKNIDTYRESMRQRIALRAADMPEGEPFDFVELFAEKMPMDIVGTLIGAPPEDHATIAHWTGQLGLIAPANLQENLPLIDAATLSLRAYVRDLAAERSKQEDLGTDLLGRLLTIQRDTEGISDEEMNTLFVMMFLGGQDTTRFQLGSAMAFFLESPSMWKQLAEQPDLVEHAAAEILRYRPAVPENFRFAIEDAIINDVLIPKGTYISISAAAANRDPKCTYEGEKFIMDRPIANNATFGKGPHFCIGQALARTELEEALRTLPPLMPNIRPEGLVEWHIPRAITGPLKVPMSFTRDA